MNAQVHDFPATPETKPPKKRTISLTNRAPIQIIEDEWPVIAEGRWRGGDPESPWYWSINMKLRRAENPTASWQTNYIIHAVYDATNEVRDFEDDDNHIVRVGRVLSKDAALSDLWKHIQEVGEELRERILLENKKKYVTHVVDQVLGNLPAQNP